MVSYSRQNSRDVLQDLMSDRILLVDGSMGALIYSKSPTEADYRGERFRAHPVDLKNCTDALVLTQPWPSSATICVQRPDLERRLLALAGEAGSLLHGGFLGTSVHIWCNST